MLIKLIVAVALISMFSFTACDEETVQEEARFWIIDEEENFGFIDKTGEVVIEPTFDSIDNKYELFGIASPIPVEEEGSWGYINLDGEWVVKPQYEHAIPMSEGKGAVISEKDGGLVDEIINEEGEKLFIFNGEREFPQANFTLPRLVFSEGKAVAEKDRESGKLGFINEQGDYVIEPKFERVRPFNQNLAHAEKNDRRGFINKQGEFEIILDEKDYEMLLLDFGEEGLAPVKYEGNLSFVDTEGDIALETEFDSGLQFLEGYAPAEKDGKWGFINTEGETVIDLKYDSAEHFYGNYAAVEIDDKWGIINKEGEKIIEPQYDIVRRNRLEYGLVWFEHNEKVKYVNKDNEVVWKID